MDNVAVGCRWALLGCLVGGMAGPALAQDAPADDAVIEEVVVVGSQIRGAQITEALPVTVISAEDIEALGVNSGDELLEYMAEQGQNFFSEAENISGGVNSARGDIGAYNLRNLGTGNTLVLLNGRRMVNAASYQTEAVGGSFIPVNTVNAQALPVTGLRRAEVLKDGASAIYGADAVAGVVNYVLRDDFEGFRLRLRGDTWDNLPRDAQRVTAEWGQMFNEERTRLGVFVNYYERDRVNAQDDDRWADSDFRSRLDPDSPWASTTRFRNNSINSEYGQFDVVSNVDGTGLEGTLTDSRGEFETYPTGDARCQYDIGPGICGAVDGQGTFRHNLNSRRDLSGELKRTNIYAYFNHTFDNGLESFNELTGYLSRTNTNRHGSARLSAVSRHRIAADNFYNPLGPCGSPHRLPAALIPGVPCSGLELEVDNYRFVDPTRVVDNDGDTWRIVSGLRGSVDLWDWEGAVTWSRATKEDVTSGRISNQLLQEGLNDPTEAAINLFSAPRATNIERAVVDVQRDNETELRMIDFKVSNARLIDLPAGPLAVLAGIEYREESFDDDRDPRLDGTITFTDQSGNTFPFISDVVNSSPTPDSDGERDVTSLFAEVQVPVFSMLDVQAALRYENFSDVGDTTVGKVAFGFRPTDWLLVRGSWSEAFRAPNLVTVNESGVARSNTRDDFVCFFVDPDEDTLDCSYGIQRTAAGSDQLEAEESTNTNIGVVLEPLEGLTFTLDFWEIEKDDTIGLFGEENHVVLELVDLIQAGTANCGALMTNPAVVRGAADPTNAALFQAAGICPVGEVQRVDDRYANLDTRTISGYDIGAYFERDTPIGRFDIRIVASFLHEYEQKAGGRAAELVAAKDSGLLPADIPVVGFADLVRQDGNPESKVTTRVRWTRGPLGAAFSSVHYGDFIQTSLTLSDGSEWVVDEMDVYNISGEYRFGELWGVDTKVRVGVNNFTDERAPLADRFFGFYADQHSDFGRSYYLDLSLQF